MNECPFRQSVARLKRTNTLPTVLEIVELHALTRYSLSRHSILENSSRWTVVIPCHIAADASPIPVNAMRNTSQEIALQP
jgi:hypothetical protein